MNIVQLTILVKDTLIHFLILIISIYSLTFGILFRVMSDEQSYYDNCSDKNFVSWSRSTSNSLFSILLLQFITFVIYTTSPIQKETFNIFCCFSLYLLFTCLVGLSSSDNSNCGQLHKLAATFYIMSFLGLGGIVPYVLYNKVKKYKKKQVSE